LNPVLLATHATYILRNCFDCFTVGSSRQNYPIFPDVSLILKGMIELESPSEDDNLEDDNTVSNLPKIATRSLKLATKTISKFQRL